MHFGELMAMGPEKSLEYLNDPNNLENFLEKIATFNMTTPSSAKMIKQLAEPIASEVDEKEVLETVGYVKRCRSGEKSDLIWILHNLKNKNNITAEAAIAFFENEISTLTYPDILFEQIWNIKSLLADYGIDESKFPEIAQIEKDQEAYRKKFSKIYENMSPEERGEFNSKIQKEDYEYALKLQPRIKFLLEKIKRNFI